jgi:hypothetical protein
MFSSVIPNNFGRILCKPRFTTSVAFNCSVPSKNPASCFPHDFLVSPSVIQSFPSLPELTTGPIPEIVERGPKAVGSSQFLAFLTDAKLARVASKI